MVLEKVSVFFLLGSYSSDFKHIFLLARLADRGDNDVLGDVGGGGGTSELPSYNFRVGGTDVGVLLLGF